MNSNKYINGNVVEMADIRVKYPMAFEGRKTQYTILKHIYIYNEYIRVKSEVAKRFPEVVDYLPRRYYYMIISERFSISQNYVCALITRIKRKGEEAFKEAEEAKLKIIDDEYKRDLKRKRPKDF